MNLKEHEITELKVDFVTVYGRNVNENEGTKRRL